LIIGFIFSIFHSIYKNNSDLNKKHAILLLSSYGIDYLNSFLSQFKNDKRYDIFIHLDGKTKNDIDNGRKIKKSNIKYRKHLYKSKRFSFEMVKVMYLLLSESYKKGRYKYYHFFSDSCYLVKSLDKFYNFFNGNKSYFPFHKNKFSIYHNKSNIFYKGSQWMSLHKDIVNEVLKHKYLFSQYEEEINNGTLTIFARYGAFDEHIIQTIIISDICNGNPKKYNIEKKNIRYFRWHNCSKEYCPNYLNIDNVNEKEIKNINKNFLIIRKINYKDPKSRELLKKIRIFS
jgi:hypothetical protein